jgi:hypothetical protein
MTGDSIVSVRPLLEPPPCVGPVRDLWPAKKPPGLGRAISNIVVRRLCPDLLGAASWPLETRAMGSRQLCFIYPALPPGGHYFTFSRKAAGEVAAAAASQAVRPAGVRAEVVLLAAYRSQDAPAADRDLHVWAIPADAVAEMDRRVSQPGRNNRNVGIRDGGTTWVETKPAGTLPIAIGVHSCRWRLSDAELAYVAEERAGEEPGTRVRR